MSSSASPKKINECVKMRLSNKIICGLFAASVVTACVPEALTVLNGGLESWGDGKGDNTQTVIAAKESEYDRETWPKVLYGTALALFVGALGTMAYFHDTPAGRRHPFHTRHNKYNAN